MPTTSSAASVPGSQDEAPPQSRFSSALQMVAIFAIVQFGISQFMGSKPTAIQSQDGTKILVPSTVPLFEQRARTSLTTYNPTPQNVAPIWPTDSELDLDVYINPSLLMGSTSQASVTTRVIHEQSIKMGNMSESRSVEHIIQVPKSVQNNGSWYLHFYLGLHGATLDPEASTWDPSKAYHFVRPLNQYLPKKKIAQKKSLLSGSSDESLNDEKATTPETDSKKPIISSFYHPNFTLSIVPDTGVARYPVMHPAVRQYMHLESSGARDESGQNAWYYPLLFVNTFWQLRDHMTELNTTTTQLPLHITINNMKHWQMAIIASIDDSMKQSQRQVASGGPIPASGDGSELEMLKRVLLDTNIYLLSTTVIVSIFHMIFEFLAFKSDVSHWRNKKDNVGVSVRTILANVFMQGIIFLYLLDNSDGTSWMILFGQGMGIVVEAWKITKTVDVRIRPSTGLLPYKITFEDKHKLSETEVKTKEYDEIAFRYLFWVAVPLLVAYAIYSVIYETHKSWYSFVIATLVGSVYAYGFLMMVPSLYINYRLKSVAHLPARAMTYKFLNTFIDDLFAFTIKMPTLHRLATLRDDVIFFVYLYQAWAYKVDYTRVNEFGQGGDEATEPTKSKEGEEAKGKTVEVPKEATLKVSGADLGSGDAKQRKAAKTAL